MPAEERLDAPPRVRCGRPVEVRSAEEAADDPERQWEPIVVMVVHAGIVDDNDAQDPTG
jgi:hypothetical protein